MPGYLGNFLRRTTIRCSSCGGVDLLSLGFIHHDPKCPRSPCAFCGNEIMPGESRIIFNGRTAHEDCKNDYEHHLDQEREDAR